MERAEITFDALRPEMEAHQFAQWSRAELEVFLALIAEYHSARHTDSAGTGVDGEDAPCGSPGEGAVEGEKVAAVDRSLARLRAYLLDRHPYGSLPEPTHAPSTPATDEAPHKRRRPEGAAPVSPVVFAVDAFLYQEEDMEELAAQGHIAREYCRACGSTDMAPSTWITHSLSQDQVVFLSCFLLPALLRGGGAAGTGAGRDGGKVVEVGSRLGVALWSCLFAAQGGLLPGTTALVGVELCPTFAALQREVAGRFGGGATADAPHPVHVEIIQGDCLAGAGAAAVASADVLLLHNVFEYFTASTEAHAQCWQRLRALVRRPGQLLICVPPLEQTLAAFPADLLADSGAASSPAPPSSGAVQDAEGPCPVWQHWLDSYVKAIDVGAVADAFLRWRSPRPQAVCHDDHVCTSASSCDGGGLSELEETIRSFSVYQVR